MALAGLVGSCAGLPPARDRAGLSLGTDGITYQGPALSAAAAAFLGPEGGGGSAGGGASGGGSVPLNVFTPGSGTEYHRTRTHHAGLWAERVQPLGHGLDLSLRADAGLGQSRYSLPRGVGMLQDSMAVDFSDASARLQLGLGAGAAIRPTARLRVIAGVGVRAVRSRTTLDSALIHLTNRRSRTIGFTYAEVALDVAPRHDPAFRLTADVARDADGAYGYEMRLDLPF